MKIDAGQSQAEHSSRSVSADAPRQGMRISAKTKITLIATSLFLVSLLIVSAIQLYYVKAEMKTVLAEQQHAFVAQVADDLDQKLLATRDIVEAVAITISPEIVADPGKLQKWVSERPGLRQIFTDIFVISAKGVVLVDSPQKSRAGIDVSDREYFRSTVESRKPYISKPILGRGVKQPVVTFSAPVFDEHGAVNAVLSGTLNLLQPNFLGNLAEAKVGKVGSFAVFTRDRTIVVSRDKSRILMQGPAPGVSPYFDRATAGLDDSEEALNSRGLRAIFSYKQLTAVPWVLVASLPVDEAYAPIEVAQRHLLVVTLLLGLAIAPLVWLVLRRLYDPLQKALRESAGSYRTLFLYAPDGILIADSESYYLDANPSICRLLGYTRDELIGMHASDIVAQSEIEQIKPALKAITSTSDYRREWQFKRKDGSLFAGEVLGATMPDGTLVGIIRDVSERKRAEQALRDRDMAERASRMRAEFLAKMSHELRTPLNAILGFTGTLLMKLPGPLNANQEKQLRTVATSGKQLLVLINDLLDLAKIDAGKVEINPEPTNCRVVLEEALEVLRPLAANKGLELRLSVPTDELMINTDGRALNQIILNLLSNAIKFTERGSIRLMLSQRNWNGNNVVDISVQDTGAGIRPEDQGGLFTEFARLDATKHKEGTGLGLHLSKKLAELLGGTIMCESEYGKGSTFTLTVPLG